MRRKGNRNSSHGQWAAWWKLAAISCLLSAVCLTAAVTLLLAAAVPPDPTRGSPGAADMLAPSVDSAHPLSSPQQTPASWRDTFDDWEGLYAKSNVKVSGGALSLAPNNRWEQTTQADFEAGTHQNTETTTKPGTVRLQRQPRFAATVQVNDDIGTADKHHLAIAVDAAGNICVVWTDQRNGNRDIYSACRQAGGSWEANVKINDDIGTISQGRPAIAMDAVGNAYAIWQDERNGNSDIYFAYRPAGGSWSANVKVNDDAGISGQYDPDIAVDAAGNAYAVWQDERNGNSDTYFAYRPAGGSWSANIKVNDDTGTVRQYNPVIAADAVGNAYTVWEDYRNGYYPDIYFAYQPVGGGWGANDKVNDDTGTAGQHSPDIAVDAVGNAYAIWEDTRNDLDDRDIYFAYRPFDEGRWSTNEKVNDDTGTAGQYDPAIGVDAAGNTYAVWTDLRDFWSIYFAYRPSRGIWGANVKLEDAFYPAIAVGAAGNVYIVWMDNRNGNDDIYFTYLLPWDTFHPTGTLTSDVYDTGDRSIWDTISWDATTPPGTSVTFQTHSGNTRMPDGTWSGWSNPYTTTGALVTSPPARYVQYRANLLTTDPQSTPTLHGITMSHRSRTFAHNSFADFSAGVSVGVEISTSGFVRLLHPFVVPNVQVDQIVTDDVWSSPAIAVDTAGNAYAVWQDNRTGDWDIYFAYRPAGGSWGPSVKVNDDVGTADQITPDIAVDATGNVCAVWTDRRNGNKDIYSACWQAGGRWGASVKVNDDIGIAGQYDPAIAMDAAGNAYAVWTDERHGNTDIYFAYRPADGSWGPSVKVNDDTGTAGQSNPTIAVDAAGNAYAVWEDVRNFIYAPDIYFAYRPAGGTWGSNSKVNDDTGTTAHKYPSIAVDAAGNAHAVWEDTRSSWNIYSAYRPAGGSWGVNVKVNDDINTAIGGKGDPAIAVDAANNAYAVWVDYRNDPHGFCGYITCDSDIYFAYRPAGGDWGINLKINDDAGTQRQYRPAISVDTSGNTYVVWRDQRNGIGDIYFALLLSQDTFYPAGTLTSTVYDTGDGGIWDTISWDAITPPDTVVAFQTRSGTTPALPDDTDEAWSGWSSPYMISGAPVTSPPAQYLQYKATLSTTDPYTTPVLSEVVIDWHQYHPFGSAASAPITPPPGFLRWKNLYFAADTPGHTSLTVDVLSITGTVLISNVASGDSLAAIDSVAHPSIRLRTNLERSLDPTHTPRLDEWMVTWRPPPPEQHVRLFDEGGTPIAGARIYQNGDLIGSTDDLGVFGFYPPTHTLSISDMLVALALVDEQPSFREGHQTPDSPQNWAFRTYVTNMEVGDDGFYTHVVTQTGRQPLTVKKSNPLVLFNLVVSVEWDATDEYMEEITRAVQLASDYLYDLTDGQMIFGEVTIYDNGGYWADADIQISTKNTVHPHAYIGGITSEDTSHVIRIGRGWDGNSGNQGPWDQPEGYRTLAHEFAHYALYVYDEYFAYIFDQNNNLVGEVRAYCTMPKELLPEDDAASASAMYYHYRTSELSARGVPGLWSPLCEATYQWQRTEQLLGYGESAWETLARKYADTVSPPRWQFITPIDRGSVLTEPTGLPADLLPLPVVRVDNTGASGQPRHLTVYHPNGGGYWGAIVALYKRNNGPVIGQGFTDSNGQLEIYGAEEGDKLQAASFDGGLAGSIPVSTEMTITLILEPVGGLMAQAEGPTTQTVDKPPHMRVIANPSLNPSQIDLSIYLQNFGPDADPDVTVTEPSSGVSYSPSTWSYSPTTDTYEGQVSFSATRQGMWRIRAKAPMGNSWVRLQSTYRLQRVVNDKSHDVYSNDGNLSLHLDPGSLEGSDAYFVVMPPGAVPGPLPAGRVLVGDPYDVTASGAVWELEKPAVLKLHYDGTLVSQSSAPTELGVYWWKWDAISQTGEWQAMPGSLDEEQRAVVVTVTALGTYALLAPACYDVNSDDEVDIADVQAVASRWHDPSQYDSRYDVVPDGVINILDVMTVAAHWRERCGGIPLTR